LLKGLTKPGVVAALGRHERMFASSGNRSLDTLMASLQVQSRTRRSGTQAGRAISTSAGPPVTHRASAATGRAMRATAQLHPQHDCCCSGPIRPEPYTASAPPASAKSIPKPAKSAVCGPKPKNSPVAIQSMAMPSDPAAATTSPMMSARGLG
jgi:hypothetical protein